MGVAAYTCSCDCSLCDCLLILNLRSALLEKMPVMESKLSPEPVTNGEVPSQPEVETKQGTMSTCYIKGAQSRYLIYFEHRQNYLEGNLKITLYRDRKTSKR